MDLHNISVGDIVINSINEEAKVTDIGFFSNDVRLCFDRDITGWIDSHPDDGWYYFYDGKFLTSEDDYDRNKADIVKVIKHD